MNGNATFIDTDDADLEVASGTFAVTKTLNENNEEEHHVVVGTPIYHLIFRDSDTGDMSWIEISTNKWNMMFVQFHSVDSHYALPAGSVGLLGSPDHLPLFARDGKTDLRFNHTALGDEWQVRTDEPKLFQDNTYVPQHPDGCIYEDIGGGEEKQSNIRRRAYLDDLISPKAAAEACAQASDHKREFCIEDVIATGFLELASDVFYHS